MNEFKRGRAFARDEPCSRKYNFAWVIVYEKSVILLANILMIIKLLDFSLIAKNTREIYNKNHYKQSVIIHTFNHLNHIKYG